VQFCIYKTVPTRNAKNPEKKPGKKHPTKNNKTPAKTPTAKTFQQNLQHNISKRLAKHGSAQCLYNHGEQPHRTPHGTMDKNT